MESTLKVINLMQEEGLFSTFAIGGGIAALFYIEPITTFDLDIFVIISDSQGYLVALSPIYAWLGKKGYKPQKEQIIIEGVPVQFIPVYNDLITDSVNDAVVKKYGGTETCVLSPEYLMAIMLQTYRPKDKERLIKFIAQSDISYEVLNSILDKHNLTKVFENFRKQFYD